MTTKPLDLDKLKSKDPKVKYGFAKELLKTGADNPGLLYDNFDDWIKMMTGDNNVLKWTAIDIIGYLSAVDKDNKTDGKIKDIIELLHGGNLITSNHAVFALGLIAKNKPGKRKEIIKELLLVSKDKFDNQDCHDIVTGKVLETLKKFLNDIRDDQDVLNFIKQAERCRRPATRKKAVYLRNKIKKLS
ncbi:MAG: hypothetical protein GXO83_03145 [Chlorobi bacterium]|nr:hypothetical protein [Chlorobiota bacterium]